MFGSRKAAEIITESNSPVLITKGKKCAAKCRAGKKAATGANLETLACPENGQLKIASDSYSP
jgi:hypothetical protein